MRCLNSGKTFFSEDIEDQCSWCGSRDIPGDNCVSLRSFLYVATIYYAVLAAINAKQK